MRSTVCVLVLLATSVLSAQQPAPQQAAPAPEDPIKTIVGPPRSREVQGDDQGSDAVRRSAAGDRAQPRRARLDRGAAQELRLHEHRAHHVYLHAAWRQGCYGCWCEVLRGARCCRCCRCAQVLQALRVPRRRRRRARQCGSECRAGRQPDPRHAPAHRREQRSERAARRQAPRVEHRADAGRAGRAAGRLLHQGRHHPARARCTSSARTWTASAGVKRRTTTARARRS